MRKSPSLRHFFPKTQNSVDQPPFSSHRVLVPGRPAQPNAAVDRMSAQKAGWTVNRHFTIGNLYPWLMPTSV
jgi:hypothetical protein